MNISYGTIMVTDARIRHLIKVQIDFDGENYTTTEDLTKVWGNGGTLMDSLEDLLNQLVSYRVAFTAFPNATPVIKHELNLLSRVLTGPDEEDES